LAELSCWSITKNASIPAQPGRSFAVFTVISWVRRKRGLFRLFPFSKTERRGCQKWPFSYFSRPPLPSKKRKTRKSRPTKRRLSFCDAAKKRKSNVVFECSASPTPRGQKHMVFSHDFCIGKAHIWLAERAKFRGSHGGAPETGFKGLGFQG
jgi:hypothetical protein